MGHHHQGNAGHIHTVYRTFVHAPTQQAIAGALVGVFTHPTGAQNVAGTNFEQSSLNLVCHF
jgi:hypothetical protein